MFVASPTFGEVAIVHRCRSSALLTAAGSSVLTAARLFESSSSRWRERDFGFCAQITTHIGFISYMLYAAAHFMSLLALLSSLVAFASATNWPEGSSFLHSPYVRWSRKDANTIGSRSTHRRPATTLCAAVTISTDNCVNATSSGARLIPPTRCSSRDAAFLIQNSTAHDGLLIITCDASGRGVSCSFT